ncbi:carbohydrate binding family 9 domain-containing protein [Spirosoma agri]|uniref:Carbohydrate binding family 9 domain-containing protein n=1 Tax=Spirosoma agri TaxID=1987381 RepID=A0A6M0IBW7_9BACT|nr:carbohydrate binding family 9 domain-containing protein [Spirosoma agri]NEU65568.1 carbohydrate binding family 9 domain-containing protein [Spirosoma agri]
MPRLSVRFILNLFLFPVGALAQTITTVPNTAQTDAIQVDSTRLDATGTDKQSVIFAPAKKRVIIQATEIHDRLKIDGHLDEAVWQRAKPIRKFTQVDPKQGRPASFDTDVRVLYNRNFLYIAAINRDLLGRRALRVPNFKRDFSAQAHDLFSVSIDGFNDQRNAMAFATNPYGTQRDLLSFDDFLYDTDWDGLWKVRTSRTDSGWVAEIQIPWQTLRYAQSTDSTQSWGINFLRNRRYSNEISAWSPFPRAFTATRMAYAGLITGLKPPPPSPNIRVQPYVLFADDRYNGTEVGIRQNAKVKIGGDLKWAINPNTVLDVTLNTDFAQADVDRQVNNLTRFSVLFPERRAFFLENASLFGAGLPGNTNTGEGGSMVIQPFFSRTIGLANLPDGTSTPVPIDAGARLVYRSLNRNYGGMYIRQRGIPGSPATDFAVGRYVENVGKQNRIGGLFALKNVHDGDGIDGHQNGTVAIDGFFRLGQSLSYSAMIIGSLTSGASQQGMAAYSQFMYRSNQLVGWLTQSIVTKSFNPEMGFVSRSDVITTTPGFYLVNRSKWLPKWVRNFEPGFFVELYHKASTGYLQEAQYNANPIWLTFQNGGNFGLFVNPSFQRLDDGDYRPLSLNIASGNYRYTRYQAMFSSDPSKKISYQFMGETGRYYDGRLNYGRASLILAPIPHAAFTMNAEVNEFDNVGQYSGTIKLYSVESRLAVNPRLQLISFFQRNTYTDKNVWNIRLAWEFQPLSFLYIVYNHGTYAGSIRAMDRQQEQHIIGKLSYLKQF